MGSNVYDIVLDIAAKYGLKKGHGRWYGPCPRCGGSKRSNRFNIREDGGYKCYSCQEFKGDIITWLREMDNLSCPDAHDAAGKPCNKPLCPAADKCRLGNGSGSAVRTKRSLKPLAQKKRSGLSVSPSTDPKEIWRTWAEEFVTACSSDIPHNISSYLAGRGYDAEAVARFRIGWNPKNINVERELLGLPPREDKKKTLWIPKGLVIVILDRSDRIYRIKIRRPVEERKRFLENLKYYQIEGSGDAPMLIRPVGKSRGLLTIEAELDGQAAAVAHPQVTVVAFGSTSAPIDTDLRDEIAASPVILVALDADPKKDGKAGAGPSKADDWIAEFPQAKFWPVPSGKDIGEYFEQSGNIRLWIEAGLLPERPENQPPEDDSKTLPLSVDLRGRGGNTESVLLNKDVPAVIFELRDLLKASGVMLHKRENGQNLGIKKPADYDFDKYHKRIDELVFLDLDVGGYINTLPDGLIGPKGLIKE